MKRVIKIFTIIFIWLLLGTFVSVLNFGVVPAVYATESFSDDFEDGTLDAWTSNTTGTGDFIDATADSAKDGNYGLNATTDDASTHNAYAYKNLTQSYSNLTVSFDWRVDTGLGSWKELFRVYQLGNDHYIVRIETSNDAWRIWYRNGIDTGDTQGSSTTSSGTWYNITVFVNASCIILYKNTVEVVSVSDIDADYYGLPAGIRLGEIGHASIKVSFDNVVVTSEEEEGGEADYSYITEDLSGDYNVTADSLSCADVQAAVDDVEENGTWTQDSFGRWFLGNVFLSVGTATWADADTVTIPDGGVRIYGANQTGCSGHGTGWTSYGALTVLNKSWGGNQFFYFGHDTHGQYVLNSSVLAGIKFTRSSPENTADESDNGKTSVGIHQIPNFRIYFSMFDNAKQAIAVSANSGWYGENVSCYGVIDHCRFDNTYKLEGSGWIWGYGVTVFGNYRDDTELWDDDFTNFFGQYGWRHSVSMVFIEDCHLSRNRHVTSANLGGYIVNRYSLVDNPACDYTAGSFDIHGSTTNMGSRGFEVYNTTVYGAPDNQKIWGGNYWSLDVQQRGGSAIVTNNTFVCDTYSGYNHFISLANDDTGNNFPNTHVNNTYIWDNSYTNCTFLNNLGGYTENVEYYLRAPTMEDDEFVYLPYPYPHPLVSGEEPTYYYLTVESATGGTTDPTTGEHAYLDGAYASVEAFPSEDYTFANWTLDEGYGGTDNPTSIYMTANHTLQPNFQEEESDPIAYQYSIDFLNKKVYVQLRYDGTENPVSSANCSYVETLELTNSTGWAEFSPSSLGDFNYNSTAYPPDYPNNNISIPLAKKTFIIYSVTNVSHTITNLQTESNKFYWSATGEGSTSFKIYSIDNPYYLKINGVTKLEGDQWSKSGNIITVTDTLGSTHDYELSFSAPYNPPSPYNPNNDDDIWDDIVHDVVDSGTSFIEQYLWLSVLICVCVLAAAAVLIKMWQDSK